MTVETIFLDAGGVLVFPNWERVSAALGRRGVEVTPESLAAAEPFVKKQFDEEQVIAARSDEKLGWLYFDMLLERLGIGRTDGTAEAVRELYEYHQQANLWEYVPPSVTPSLRALRDLGARLVVVSNANGRLHHLFERVGLAGHFDCILDSYVEGVEKPDPRLFRLALERSGASADTTVHVGDLFHVDVLGARAAGLRAILLDAGNLYAGFDCPRVQSLPELVALLRDEVAPFQAARAPRA